RAPDCEGLNKIFRRRPGVAAATSQQRRGSLVLLLIGAHRLLCVNWHSIRRAACFWNRFRFRLISSLSECVPIPSSCNCFPARFFALVSWTGPGGKRNAGCAYLMAGGAHGRSKAQSC